jgi:hypothetical protein
MMNQTDIEVGQAFIHSELDRLEGKYNISLTLQQEERVLELGDRPIRRFDDCNWVTDGFLQWLADTSRKAYKHVIKDVRTSH